MGWHKHRGAVENFAVDFADRLFDDETISAPEVTIYRRRGGADVATEFVADGSPTATGTNVQIVLKAAAEGEQAVGSYRVHAKATTSLNRVLVNEQPVILSVAA